MPADTDISRELQAAVQNAAARAVGLSIVGGGTKKFYGRAAEGLAFSVAGHRGILAHEPTELVMTARAGTLLADIEAALAKQNQMLGFEPPHFGAAATLGGTIACGFSGPRRPYAGSARDFVLGATILNGKGEVLRFGGQVMKNVAGFDVSRLMVGALGTLGVLLEVSLKVLPRPEAELTLAFALPAERAIRAMNEWAGQPLPLSAAVHVGDTLYIRMSGAETTLRAARARLGGDPVGNGEAFWQEWREQRHAFFDGPLPLWRLAVPPATVLMNLPGRWATDWGGGQRWLKSDASLTDIHFAVEEAGGHATLFRGGDRVSSVFHLLPTAPAVLHMRLKQAFDPTGILNHGRLYAYM